MQVRCAKCMSPNVEPRGNVWHCNACGADSPNAAAEQPAPPRPPKKRR